jgi:hypothetical protein
VAEVTLSPSVGTLISVDIDGSPLPAQPMPNAAATNAACSI